MSEYVLKNEGEIVEGFDSSSPISWCTPQRLGMYACITAHAEGKQVTLSVTVHTPIGNFTKSFSFNSNFCFTWKPVKYISVTTSASNFGISGDHINFTLSVKACLRTYLCTPTFSQSFSIPLRGKEAHELLQDENQLLYALILSQQFKENEGHCNCK